MDSSIEALYTSGIKSNLSTKIAREIAQECDIGGDEIFSRREVIFCWALASNVEYVMLKLLKENPATLDVYGTCGSLYSVQYVSNNVFFIPLSSLSEQRSWALRARVAIALLNMVKALEVTPFGPLYLCKMDRQNIGVVSYGLVMLL